MPKESYDTLFKKYVEVCNKAVAAHKDDFPYKQIWGASTAFIGDRPINMTVYDDTPKESYSLYVKDHKFVLGEEEKPDPKHAWRVNKSYLTHVVKHPEEYIENPAKLDWDWLRSRMGTL